MLDEIRGKLESAIDLFDGQFDNAFELVQKRFGIEVDYAAVLSGLRDSEPYIQQKIDAIMASEERGALIASYDDAAAVLAAASDAIRQHDQLLLSPFGKDSIQYAMDWQPRVRPVELVRENKRGNATQRTTLGKAIGTGRGKASRPWQYGTRRLAGVFDVFTVTITTDTLTVVSADGADTFTRDWNGSAKLLRQYSDEMRQWCLDLLRANGVDTPADNTSIGHPRDTYGFPTYDTLTEEDWKNVIG